jgi:FtsH-binding integral membrane protein
VSRRTLASLVLTCFLAGVVLMIGFETPLARAIGVVCLLAFVAGGLFVIVDPVLLSDEGDADR